MNGWLPGEPTINAPMWESETWRKLPTWEQRYSALMAGLSPVELSQIRYRAKMRNKALQEAEESVM